ncbi:MAG: tyrosine-type recombinase/integrase [Methanothrix sp.]
MTFLDDFLLDLQLRGLAPTTIESNIYIMRRYLAWCEAQSLDPANAGRGDLKSYLAYRRAEGKKVATLRKIFSTLTTFYEWLEEEGKSSASPIRAVKKKYLRSYKMDAESRKIISIEEAAKMVAATLGTRDRAILLVFLKTGIRKGELISLDTSDISLDGLSITLKPTAKRSNRIVFFDEETAEALQRWLKARAKLVAQDSALFIGEGGIRLNRGGVRLVVVKAAVRVGLADPHSKKMEERFSPHCCRHWHATHLLRSGMPREYVQWLRGDKTKEAVDIYYHIDPEDVRKSYLAHIPQLGI